MSDYFSTTSKYTRSVIFDYLRVIDLAPLVFVSKKMHQYIRDYTQESRVIKIKENDIARLSKLKDIKLFFSSFPKLISLKINAFNMTTDCFLYIPRTIATLSLTNCKESLLRDSNFFLNILDRVSHSLENLKIEYHEDETEYGIIPTEFLQVVKNFAAGLKLLKNLAVHIIFKNQHKYYTRSMTNLLFYTFHQHSPNVQYLHFNYLVVIPSFPKPNTSVKALKVESSDGYAPKFEDTNIFFGVNTSTINLLATKFTDLSEIILTDHLMMKKSLTDTVVSNLIEKHPNLNALCLNCYSDKFSVPDTCILHTLSSLNSLDRLGFASCKNFCVSSILSITQNFLKIRSLNLDFTDIDDTDIWNMTDMIERLEMLSLKCCFKITEEGFVYLCQHLFELKIANFKYVKCFGSQALNCLVTSATKLKKLKLANNSVSNEDLFRVLSNPRNLNDLTWSAMNSTDEFSQECFLQCIQEGITCWKLKNLDLSQNGSLSDDSISDLCHLNLPSLCDLSLNRCRNLTVMSLKTLSLSRLRDKLITLNFSIEGVILEKGEFGQILEKMKKLATILIHDCQKHKCLVPIYENRIEITLI